MPFQSEKQRRYLWANEPEIARDWTDTYGSGIAKALGGRIGLRRGGGPGPGGQGARGQATQNPGTGGRNEPPGGGDRRMTYTAPTGPINVHADTGPVINQQKIADDLNRQNQMRDLINRQQQEKDYRDTRYMAHDFGNYGLGGQQKINEYQPRFGQRFKTGIGNLFSGLGGGLRNLAGFVNPLAFAIDNPYARMAVNYMGKKFAPNLYNKWSNQDSGWTDPDEKEDVAWENINYNPNALTRLQQLGIMSPDILPEDKSYESLMDDRTLMADLSSNDIKLINYAKKHGLTTPTEIRETVGAGFNQEKPPTDEEIKAVIEGTTTKPTGILA